MAFNNKNWIHINSSNDWIQELFWRPNDRIIRSKRIVYNRTDLNIDINPTVRQREYNCRTVCFHFGRDIQNRIPDKHTRSNKCTETGTGDIRCHYLCHKSNQFQHFNTRRRKLELVFNDTYGSTINGTAALLNQWRKGVVAFFGPEDSCEVEATIAAALKLPMISYKCTDSKVSKKDFYSTFARTHPPDTTNSTVCDSIAFILSLE